MKKIIEKKENKVEQSKVLGATLPNIEITLALPHTALFLRSTSVQQKRLYMSKYQMLITHIVSLIKDHDCVYEYSRNGQVHMHASIRLLSTARYNITGLVSDIAKIYLQTLTKKYSGFNPKLMVYHDNDNTVGYHCPSISIKHCVHQSDRLIKWQEYLQKDQ